MRRIIDFYMELLAIKELLQKIKLNLIHTPSLPLPLFHASYRYFQHQFHVKERHHIFFNCKTIKLVLRILELCFIVRQNLQQRKIVTKRNLYYRLIKYYTEYSQIDDDIKIICQSTGLKRKQLNIVAACKCLIFGKIQFQIEDKIYGSFQEITLISVPTFKEVQVGKLGHKKVILIEKQTIFYQLKQCVHSQYMLITAKGYPDTSTRELLHQIARCVDAVYYLGDYDPFGFDIFCVYAFGNEELKGLYEIIHLLQLKNNEIFNQENIQTRPFDDQDRKKITFMKKKYTFDQNIEKQIKWEKYFNALIDADVKIELEEFLRVKKYENWYEKLM